MTSTLEWNSGLCDPCYTMKRHEEDQREKSKTHLELRMERWEKICPEVYRNNSLDFMDENKFKRVTSWKFNPNGIICMGDSRKGKTTSCWHLLHKLFVLEARTFVAISEPEFAITREKQTRLGGLDAWLKMCIAADIFFIDDIGHAASTSRHMEELYHIVEKRTSWKKPIIATTQFSPNEIQAKAARNEKTAIAILNRMFSFCDIIEF